MPAAFLRNACLLSFVQPTFMHSDCHASILLFWSAVRFRLARFAHDFWFDAFFAQHAMSPALSFANAGNATSIAAAMTTVPIILTMVTSQTYAFYLMFKLAAEKDEALQRCLFSSTGASRAGI